MQKKNIGDLKKLASKCLEMVSPKDQRLGDGEMALWDIPLQMTDLPYTKQEIASKYNGDLIR